MPKLVVPVRFKADQGTGYLLDNGLEKSANSRFILPPDVNPSEVSTILTNIGAQPLSANNDPVVCSDTTNADLRRLVFLRSNGGSMSVPVSSRADLLSVATVIRGILNSAGPEVVCIKLVGEYFPDLGDELGLNYNNTNAVSHVPVGGAKQFYHAGNIAYQSDAATGVGGSSTVFQPIKSITDIEDAPATQIASVWTGCVGDFEDALACRGRGRRNPRKHRRYILTFQTPVNNSALPGTTRTEQIELPVRNSTASDILTCGQNAAALTGLYCIGYKGESYGQYHKLLG